MVILMKKNKTRKWIYHPVITANFRASERWINKQCQEGWQPIAIYLNGLFCFERIPEKGKWLYSDWFYSRHQTGKLEMVNFHALEISMRDMVPIAQILAKWTSLRLFRIRAKGDINWYMHNAMDAFGIFEIEMNSPDIILQHVVDIFRNEQNELILRYNFLLLAMSAFLSVLSGMALLYTQTTDCLLFVTLLVTVLLACTCFLSWIQMQQNQKKRKQKEIEETADWARLYVQDALDDSFGKGYYTVTVLQEPFCDMKPDYIMVACYYHPRNADFVFSRCEPNTVQRRAQNVDRQGALKRRHLKKCHQKGYRFCAFLLVKKHGAGNEKPLE